MKEFIDKLISKLDEKSYLVPKRPGSTGDYADSVVDIGDAISIVNQLAEEYNNDFCEHIFASGVTSCGQIFPGDSESGICPYCGKKIKVVE